MLLLSATSYAEYAQEVKQLKPGTPDLATFQRLVETSHATRKILMREEDLMSMEVRAERC